MACRLPAGALPASSSLGAPEPTGTPQPLARALTGAADAAGAGQPGSPAAGRRERGALSPRLRRFWARAAPYRRNGTPELLAVDQPGETSRPGAAGGQALPCARLATRRAGARRLRAVARGQGGSGDFAGTGAPRAGVRGQPAGLEDRGRDHRRPLRRQDWLVPQTGHGAVRGYRRAARRASRPALRHGADRAGRSGYWARAAQPRGAAGAARRAETSGAD